MLTCMSADDVAWEQSDAISDAWAERLFEKETLLAIGRFIAKHRRGVPIELFSPKEGAFNVSFKVEFEDGGAAMIRFPKPGVTMFPEEKIRNEVAAIRYIQENTSIPVPFIIHWGSKEESPQGLGPFIIMEYIEHAMDLGAALNTPGYGADTPPVLDPNIDQEKLEMLYGQVADVLLQLSRLSLLRIGSLAQRDDFTWGVASRPLSINMNELVRVGTLPRSQLPGKHTCFNTASDYFKVLAELQFKHLTHQRNDAVESEADCRRKYIARHLFSKLAREGRLTSPITDSGPFKLWCDDLRPSNILVNEDLQIVGVIDWEFTYAAPNEFSHAPPWWLLLEQPEYWPGGIDGWTKVYEPRLQTFLQVLEQREDVAIGRDRLREEERLSSAMRQSWTSGDFWVTYAARKNFAFDSVFWAYINQRYFGDHASWLDQLECLKQGEKEDMEALVERKLEEMKSRALAWEPDEEL
ncbi:hypothetical protein MaudCBS49596_004704 [Microsporum audouinii]